MPNAAAVPDAPCGPAPGSDQTQHSPLVAYRCRKVFWVDKIMSSGKSELCSPLQANNRGSSRTESSCLPLASKISIAGATCPGRYFKVGFDLHLCKRFEDLTMD